MNWVICGLAALLICLTIWRIIMNAVETADIRRYYKIAYYEWGWPRGSRKKRRFK